MLQIFYLPDDRLVDSGEATTILDASLQAGIPHTHVCGGNARCSTCRVLVLEGAEHCAPRTRAEQDLAKRLHFEPEVRLACQTELKGTGKVVLRRLSLDAWDLDMFHDEAFGKVAPRFMGHERDLAIMFADIRGFTAFSEALLPYDVIYVLDRYYQLMNQVINKYGGVITVYMGDGFMALFGIEEQDRSAERAVRAGMEMLAALDKLNPSLEKLHNRSLKIGIGIHYGCAVLGTIGDPNAPNWTAIGDSVNLASRIESANKQLGTSFLISEETYQEVKELVTVNPCMQLHLPGKSGEYHLYEVLGVAELDPNPFLETAVKSQTQPSLKDWMDKIKLIITGLFDRLN